LEETTGISPTDAKALILALEELALRDIPLRWDNIKACTQSEVPWRAVRQTLWWAWTNASTDEFAAAHPEDLKRIMKALWRTVEKGVTADSLTPQGKLELHQALAPALHPIEWFQFLKNHLEKLRQNAVAHMATAPQRGGTGQGGQGTDKPRATKEERKLRWDTKNQGAPEKRARTERIAAEAEKTLCKGCGHTHRPPCFLVKHPDYNTTDLAWKDSPNGKRWRTVAKQEALSLRYKIDGKTPWRGSSKPSAPPQRPSSPQLSRSVSSPPHTDAKRSAGSQGGRGGAGKKGTSTSPRRLPIRALRDGAINGPSIECTIVDNHTNASYTLHALLDSGSRETVISAALVNHLVVRGLSQVASRGATARV
jgi:hypothetical protein